MSEQLEKLKATITELEEELHSLDELDDDSREVLQAAVQEIQTTLEAKGPGDLESQSLTNRLNEVTRGFEGSHPTLSGIVNRLIDGLGQMGI